MCNEEVLSLSAGILTISGFAIYILDIWRKQRKPPALATWIVWLILDSVILGGMISENTLNGQIIGEVLGESGLVILAIVRGGTKKLDHWDKFSLGGAFVSIGLWLSMGEAVLGIMASLSAVLIGSIPLIRDVFEDPTSENKTPGLSTWPGVCAKFSLFGSGGNGL